MSKEDDVGRFLCYVLRHKPDAVPMFSIDNNGWGELKHLVSKDLPKQVILDAISRDTKGRFELKESPYGTLVRCVYGHSVPHVVIKSEKPIEIPNILYHGTTQKAFNRIKTQGLRTMSRNEVCLTDDISIAFSNGMRYAKNVENLVILGVNSPDTITSLRQVGKIWCCDFVPPNQLKYILPDTYKELYEN